MTQFATVNPSIRYGEHVYREGLIKCLCVGSLRRTSRSETLSLWSVLPCNPSLLGCDERQRRERLLEEFRR